MLKRRHFLKQVVSGGTGILAFPNMMCKSVRTGDSDKFGTVLPKRAFSNTGEEVTMYCMGGYHVAMAGSEKESRAIIEKGMELGIRFYETAYIYANGRAEELYGKYLIPSYRDHIFLATKNDGRSAESAKRQLEGSLRRLKCDVIDLYYMHQINDPEDVDHRIAAGVLEVLLEAQQQGKVRYLGVTGHYISTAFRKMIESVSGNDPFVAVQLPVNPVDAAKPDSFTFGLIPWLLKQNYAIMAMKSLAQGRFFAKAAPDGGFWETSDPVIPNHLSLEEVFHFVLSQPVTALVNGTDRVEQLEQNIGIVKKFTAMTPEEQEKIVEKVRGFTMTEGLEHYKPKPGTY
jgi:aryl-alcohol dehydrogenase-like predicted oxidoreductase